MYGTPLNEIASAVAPVKYSLSVLKSNAVAKPLFKAIFAATSVSPVKGLTTLISSVSNSPLSAMKAVHVSSNSISPRSNTVSALKASSKVKAASSNAAFGVASIISKLTSSSTVNSVPGTVKI